MANELKKYEEYIEKKYPAGDLPLCPCKRTKEVYRYDGETYETNSFLPECTKHDIPTYEYVCGEGLKRLAPTQKCKLETDLNKG